MEVSQVRLETGSGPRHSEPQHRRPVVGPGFVRAGGIITALGSAVSGSPVLSRAGIGSFADRGGPGCGADRCQCDRRGLTGRPLRYGSAIRVPGSGARTPPMASHFIPSEDGRRFTANVDAAYAPTLGGEGCGERE